MKKVFFFLLAFIHVTFINNVLSFENQVPFATHGMFIFLDDTEHNFGAISTAFFLALEQQAGPILFSGSLMHNILQQPSLDALIKQSTSQDEKNQLTKLLQHIGDVVQQFRLIITKEPKTLDEQMPVIAAINAAIQPDESLKQFIIDHSEQVEVAMLKEISLLNPDDWVLNKVNDYLFMLIPKKYITEMEVKFSKYPNSVNFTSRELALGLKIDHMTIITNSWIDYFSSYKRASEKEPASYFIPALPSIFISRAEYTHEMKATEASKNKAPVEQEPFRLYSIEKMPQWAIYIKGHGKLAQIISWLSLSAFVEFLDFLTKNIITKIFVYESCYSAGINLALIYKDLETNVVQSYPFPIAIAGLTDAPIFMYELRLPLYDFKPEDINFKNKRPIIRPRINYGEFLHYATSHDIISYAQALGYIFPPPKTGSEIQNQPQLKLPGVPWFNFIDSDQLLVNIGSILARTRDKNKPLNIFEFFQKTKILAVLLEARVIPFELIINTPSELPLPYFVSMIPGNALHLIRKISSTKHNALDIFKSFTQGISFLSPRKTFIFEELESTDYQGAQRLFNVVIDMNKKNISIFYTRDDIAYRLDAAFEEEKAPSNYMDGYQQLKNEDPFLQEEREAFKGIADIKKAVGKKAQKLTTGQNKKPNGNNSRKKHIT